jgi:large subunit ribosomal protein L23
MSSVLLKPHMTEKSLKDATTGIYTFLVDGHANKYSIAHEIESEYKVHVIGISTVNIKGKKKRAGKKRSVVTMPGTTKARVRLKKGEKIEAFDIGGKKE